MQDVTKDRDRFIGGSDVPIIMGISPFMTRWQLLQIKAGILENTFDGNQYTDYGNTMEPKIRDFINAMYGYEFIEDKEICGHVRYHYDGLDRDKAIALEIKTTSQIHNSVSDYKKYLVQLLTGMDMAGVDKGILAVYERPEDFDEYFDVLRLRVYAISMDEYTELFAKAQDACEMFWEDLQKLKADPSLTEADLQPYPVLAQAEIVCEMESQLMAYKTLKERYDKAKADLKQAMETFNVKSWEMPNGTKITLVPDGEDKMVKEFDQKKFVKDHPEMVEEYTVEKLKKGRAGYVRITIKEQAQQGM